MIQGEIDDFQSKILHIFEFLEVKMKLRPYSLFIIIYIILYYCI
jgi:hypothetical protein